MIFEEGNLTFDFSRATASKRFDGSGHGLSHCMKAVDFIVEVEHNILFIEAKDPQDFKITEKHRETQRQKFENKLTSKELIK